MGRQFKSSSPGDAKQLLRRSAGNAAPAARLNSLVGNRAAGQVLARETATQPAATTPALKKGEFLVTLKGKSSTTTEYSADYSQSKTTVTPATEQARFAARNFSFSVKSPRDVSSGQAAGARQYKPVTFVKEWDESSERLLQAVTTNEVFDEVTFQFFDSGSGGAAPQATRTITFTKATIASIDQGSDDQGGQTETVALVFESYRSITGKKETQDSWVAQR